MNNERRPPIFCFPLFLLMVAFWSGVLILVINLVGCGTTGAGWANIAQAAAQVGTREYLEQHPEHREAFEITAAALTILQQNGVTNSDAFAELIRSLPINALNSPTGAVYISEHPVIWDGRRASVGTNQAVMLGILSGMNAGIRDSWIARPIPSETVALGWDLVPSTTEVISNAPPSLSSVALTFRVQANQVYGIEQRDTRTLGRDASGASFVVSFVPTAWRRVETVKLPTPGEITWFTAWPPNRDVGAWRVLKLR